MVLSRRYVEASSDDEEKKVPATLSIETERELRKRKAVKRYDDDNDDDVKEKETETMGRRNGKEVAAVKVEEAVKVEDQRVPDAKPVGEPVKVTGKGIWKRAYFRQFEYNGCTYDLGETVLMVPENKETQKPYVGIIKDISQATDGYIMILGQWFYRPEETQKKNGEYWQLTDARELFYSFHQDWVHAESVMHRCVVYFIPPHKQLPKRKEHPGFIVRNVYDFVEMKLWKLTDKGYGKSKQQEINLLVQKSMSRLGDLPDLEMEEDTSLQAEAPENGEGLSLELHSILKLFDSLTGDAHRDKCLGKLLEAVQRICYISAENQVQTFLWPDAAVPPVCALEKALYASSAWDYHKYNQKMRTLVFNLKKTPLLARRLLDGELEPVKILNMSSTELKEGLTAEETNKKAPDCAGRMQMQMTGARCLICNENKVGLKDIIQAGRADRYQLECTACGHSWYASTDEVSTLAPDTQKHDHMHKE